MHHFTISLVSTARTLAACALAGGLLVGGTAQAQNHGGGVGGGVGGGNSDCNGNGVRDAIDIANGTSQDADGNGIPDECEMAPATMGPAPVRVAPQIRHVQSQRTIELSAPSLQFPAGHAMVLEQRLYLIDGQPKLVERRRALTELEVLELKLGA